MQKQSKTKGLQPKKKAGRPRLKAGDKRRKLTLTVTPGLVEAARAAGVNLSRAAEDGISSALDGRVET